MKIGARSWLRSRASTAWLGTVACGVTAVAGFTWWHTQATGNEVTRARLERAELQRQYAGGEEKVQRARQRLAATDADNQQLITTIASGAIPSTTSRLRLTNEEIGARYKRAQALEANDAASALSEYLWCFDIGFRPPDLVRRMARMSETFAAARPAMIERRDRAAARVLANPEDVETMTDLITLNRALGDQAHTLAVYDRMPNGSARQTQTDRGMLETFLTTQRYADALRVLPFEYLKQGIERAVKSDAGNAARDKAQQEIITASGGTEAQQQMQRVAIQRARAAQHKATIVESATGFEILAGAGELSQALEIARALLAFDGSAETWALLEKHATRANQADLLRELKGE